MAETLTKFALFQNALANSEAGAELNGVGAHLIWHWFLLNYGFGETFVSEATYFPVPTFMRQGSLGVE